MCDLALHARFNAEMKLWRSNRNVLQVHGERVDDAKRDIPLFPQAASHGGKMLSTPPSQLHQRSITGTFTPPASLFCSA
jgi:hypothetical protein